MDQEAVLDVCFSTPALAGLCQEPGGCAEEQAGPRAPFQRPCTSPTTSTEHELLVGANQDTSTPQVWLCDGRLWLLDFCQFVIK